MKPELRAMRFVACVLSIFGCATGNGSDGSAGAPDTSSGDSGATCTATQTACGDKCVDTLNDRDNCGGCAKSCPGGQVCVGGTCAVGCPKPEKSCGGTCVNPDTDTSNCGACGTKCSPGEVCSAGKCQLSCGPGFTDCVGASGDAGTEAGASHYCADVKTDRFNCGACGVACGPGMKCVSGACVNTCGGGLTDCGGTCKDLKDDFNNCGACGTSCKPGEVCSAGACTTSCGGGTTACSGSCKDLSSDSKNCGTCGKACAASETCRSGACTPTCSAPLALCSGVCKDLSTDSRNCGACGTACPAGQVCSGGVCAVTCGSSFTTCGGKCVNTSLDPSNCGGCGNRCNLPHATAGCAGGSCFIAFCETGWADCNGLAGDGCEVNVSADPSNCGGCGKTCSLGPNVVTVGCSGSACTITSCAPGYLHLSPVYTDGCECKDNSVSHACTAPTNEGAISPGSSISVTSNIPVAGRDDYYLVAFSGLGAVSKAAHPRVQFTTNPGSALQFDVTTGCGAVAFGCGTEIGSSTGRTDFEAFYTAGDPTNPTFNSLIGAGPPVAGPFNIDPSGGVLVRVFRASGAPACDSYTIKFSN